MIDKLEKLIDVSIRLALVPIERRLDALEAGDISGAPVAADDISEPELPAPDRSGSLVEVVARAIVGTQEAELALSWKVWCNESRAAIRAVADWLVTIYPYGDGAGGWAVKALRAELEREP